MAKLTISIDDQILIPLNVARCPRCGMAVVAKVREQQKDGPYYVVPISVEVECLEDAPADDIETIQEWNRWHYWQIEDNWLERDDDALAWMLQAYLFTERPIDPDESIRDGWQLPAAERRRLMGR